MTWEEGVAAPHGTLQLPPKAQLWGMPGIRLALHVGVHRLPSISLRAICKPSITPCSRNYPRGALRAPSHSSSLPAISRRKQGC